MGDEGNRSKQKRIVTDLLRERGGADNEAAAKIGFDQPTAAVILRAFPSDTNMKNFSFTPFARRLKLALPFVLAVGGLLGGGLVGSASGQESKPSAPPPAPDLATNPPPRVTAINRNLPTIFIAGDSTAARGSGEMQQGWAVPFADYFDRSKINVVNRARGGRSSRTFITEGLWEQLLADAKPGDIVLIQFGHNDAGAVNDTSRARGSLRGTGEETEEIDNLLTRKHEVVHTFGWYIRKMIADTKAKGATPIVLSLTIRDVWKDGKVERGSGRYSQWLAECAKTNGVQFVDAMNMVADKFDALGQEKVHALYPRDHTHFNAVGADLHAQCVIAGLKLLPQNMFAPYLRPEKP